MRRYEKYKSSGVEWLGEIPEHWEVKRVKDLTSIISKGTTPSTEGESLTDFGVRFIKAENIKENGIVSDEPSFFISEETNKLLSRSRLKDKDLLLVIAGATTGKIAVINEYQLPANTNQAVCFIRLKKTEVIDGFKYKYYFINSSYFQSLIWLYSLSSAQPNLPMAVLGRMSVYFPPFSEQTTIANYLDAKTSAIDRKIELLTAKTAKYNALRRSLINETVCRGLKPNALLKDSGIEWIGKIPAHWEVKRFKDVVAKYTTGGTPTTSNTDYFEGNNIWVCISDISESAYIYDSKIKLTDEAIRSLNIIKTPKGSLLFSFKLSIGKIAFVEKSVYTNEAILSIFPNKNIDLKYYYFMLPIFMLLAATENIYGAKMLNQKLIANALVVHPSIEEQSIIAEHLENKTAQIDTILTNISNQINKLKQLRKTLINGVVTGKIKVTED